MAQLNELLVTGSSQLLNGLGILGSTNADSILPNSTNTYSLGSSDKKWSNLYVKTSNIDTETVSILTVTNYATIGANQAATGTGTGALRVLGGISATQNSWFGKSIIMTPSSGVGIKIGTATITAASTTSGEIVLQNGHLRFGGSGWDYNVWAGLKYDPTNKTIYLGLADGTVFTANTAQSGGTLALPGVRYLSINGKIALDGNDSWLRINESKTFSSGTYFGQSIVRTDNQLQVGDGGNKFYANSSGNGYFSNTLGVGGTNLEYTLYVKGKTRFDNLLHFENGTGYTELTTESRRSKNSDNADIETITGLVTKKTSFIEIRGLAPTTMVRTTGDRPAPYGLGFGDGADSAGIMPIGSQDKLTELMFYGANSGPTIFTWKHQIWEGTTYNTGGSNGYSAAMMSLNSKTGDLYVKNTIGINGTNTTYKLYVNGTSYFTDTINLMAHTTKPLQFIRWTSSAEDNNSTGRSWYGIGTYTNANDSNQTWLNFSNYFGIDITTRGNIYLRHNNNVIPHTANTSGTVGSGIKPVYINGGVITASNSTVGDTDTPIYLAGGTITKCTTKLTDYIRKDGSNYFVQFTGGDDNTTGYRLIGQVNLGTWSNYRQTWIVGARHGGNGILTLAFGNNSSSTASISTSYCQINYYGNTDSGSIIAEDSFVAYMNGSTIYFFWKYWDYTQCNITILGGSPNKGFTPTNGTWMTSIDAATYGTRMSTTRINPSNFSTKLETPRTFKIGNTGKNFDGTANVSWTLAEIGAVAKAGDTMTGFLTLHADPTANLHAATK